MRSYQFREQIPKRVVTVNLHNPHAPVDSKNNKGLPGPASYNIIRDFDIIPETAEDGDDEDFNKPRFK